jgi:hypothetical protein
MDGQIGRWIKAGLGARRPPQSARRRLMRSAASHQMTAERVRARVEPRWNGRQRRLVIDPWSFGLAAQAAMDSFPGEIATFRVAY